MGVTLGRDAHEATYRPKAPASGGLHSGGSRWSPCGRCAGPPCSVAYVHPAGSAATRRGREGGGRSQRREGLGPKHLGCAYAPLRASPRQHSPNWSEWHARAVPPGGGGGGGKRRDAARTQRDGKAPSALSHVTRRRRRRRRRFGSPTCTCHAAAAPSVRVRMRVWRVRPPPPRQRRQRGGAPQPGRRGAGGRARAQPGRGAGGRRRPLVQVRAHRQPHRPRCVYAASPCKLDTRSGLPRHALEGRGKDSRAYSNS